MYQRIAHIALIVRDYDEAIAYYTGKLNFTLVEDTVLNETKRWVLIAPPGSVECCILLSKATTDTQRASIGNQTGGRVFLFLHTDNIMRDYDHLVSNGINILRGPKHTDFGTVIVFEDIYGNLWDLIEPKMIPD